MKAGWDAPQSLLGIGLSAPTSDTRALNEAIPGLSQLMSWLSRLTSLDASTGSARADTLHPMEGQRNMTTLSRVRHRGQRAGWLRAAVLGANDGIVSVASVAIGVIAAGASTSFVLTAAIAALVAGAMAMAAGEYVSVSSQRDVERADLDQERAELKAYPEGEKNELAAIYVKRGLPTDLAGKVAEALTASDALGAHARDELGMAAILARPVQAAIYSALSFTAGAALPIAAFLLVPTGNRTVAVVVSALLALVALGIAGARAGGAPILRAAVRVCIGGGLAMAVTAAVGHLVGGIVA